MTKFAAEISSYTLFYQILSVFSVNSVAKIKMKMKKQSKIQNLKSKIQIGCQGWNYDDWTTKAGDETVFYPRGTRSNEMLGFYAEIFDTIEVDSTFYAIPAMSAVEIDNADALR